MIVGGLIVAVFLVAAIAPGLLARQNPYALYAGPPLSAPAGAHLLGTDELGRDFFARMVYGARAVAGDVLIIVAIGAALGTAVGVVAGFSAGGSTRC